MWYKYQSQQWIKINDARAKNQLNIQAYKPNTVPLPFSKWTSDQHAPHLNILTLHLHYSNKTRMSSWCQHCRHKWCRMLLWWLPEVLPVMTKLASWRLSGLSEPVKYSFPISKVHGPTWGPPGSCRRLVGLMLAPWTLLSGLTLALFLLQSHWQYLVETLFQRYSSLAPHDCQCGCEVTLVGIDKIKCYQTTINTTKRKQFV